MTIKTFSKLVVLLAAVFVGYTYLFSTSISQIEADITSDLVGHWEMDEASWSGTSNEVIDSSISGFDGTSANGANTITDFDSKAGIFDGVDDQVTFTDNYGAMSLPLSMSAWIFLDSPDPGYIFGSHNSGDTYRGVSMSIQPNRNVSAAFGDGGPSEPASRRTKASTYGTIPLRTWTHVAAVINSSVDIELYINGVEVSGTYSGSGGGMNTGAGTPRIGLTTAGTGSPFPGRIDEVRFYDAAKTSTDISNIYGLHSSLGTIRSDPDFVGYWKLDESSYSGASDEVIDSSYSTVFSGNSVGDTAIATGQLENAASFDGAGDYIQIGEPLSGLILPVTISAWINPSCACTGQIFASHSGTKYKGIRVGVSSTGALSSSTGDNSGTSASARRSKSSSAGVVPINEWTHIAVTVRGSTDMSLYVNGAEVSGTYSGSGGTMYTASGLPQIGTFNTNYFDGLIDEVRYYNRDVGDLGVLSIYNFTGIQIHSSCPASVQARFQIDGIGLYQTGTFSQSFVNEGSPFQWSVLMNGDVNDIFGGDVTLTKPDTSTVNLSSANGVDVDNPAQIGTYSISAKATNGDVCATASVTIVADPPVCTAASIAGVGITTVSGDTDVTSVAVCGTNDVYVRNTDGDITAKMTVDLNTGRDWRAMAAENKTSAENNGGAGTALLHFPGGASSIPGLVGGSFTLYVPREAGDDYVRICPGAELLSELSGACIGGVNLSVGTTGQYTVTQVTLETRDLWAVAGVTGTGGLGVQEGRTVYIDLDAQPATLPSTISTAPEVAVSTADEFYLSYIPTSTEFGIGDAVDIVIPFDWTGLATCATSTTDADGDATGDGTLAVIDTQIIRFTFTAVTTTALSTGVEFCFAATSSPTVGNYSIAMSDTNDGDFAPALIYVGDDNDVTISATIPITLSLRIKEELTIADTNACNLGVLNPGSVNSCSYRIAAGTNISTGLQVFVSADNQLNTAGDAADIDDTAGGGIITAGTEEHGILLDLGTSWTVGGSFSESTDEPMPLTSTLILDASTAISDSSEVFWNKVTHSASVNSGTAGGSYDQLVTYRAWVDT